MIKKKLKFQKFKLFFMHSSRGFVTFDKVESAERAISEVTNNNLNLYFLNYFL